MNNQENNRYQTSKPTVRSLLNRDVNKLVTIIENYDTANLGPEQAREILYKVEQANIKQLSNYQNILTMYGINFTCLLALAEIGLKPNEQKNAHRSFFNYLTSLYSKVNTMKKCRIKKQAIEIELIELNHFPVTWIQK